MNTHIRSRLHEASHASLGEVLRQFSDPPQNYYRSLAPERADVSAGAAPRQASPLRRIFHIAIIVLIGYLLADRAVMHYQASQTGTISCTQGAQLVHSDALRKGFSEAGASSQGQAFMASCLVSGRGSIDGLIARD
jgi:hypothetical protein